MHTVRYPQTLLAFAVGAVLIPAGAERAFAQNVQSFGQAQAVPFSVWAKQPSAPSVAWPAFVEAGNKLSMDTVRQLLTSIDTNLDQPVSAVENFQFATLDNGAPYLIATVDFSGRELFYSLAVMRCSAAQCLGAFVSSAPPHNLSNEIVARPTGGDALLVKEEAGGYRGGDTLAVYTYRLLALRGGELVDVTNDMRPWFKEHIGPIVEQEAHHATAVKSKSARLIAQATADYARGAYNEEIGKPNHNLAEARDWEQSDDPAIRTLALQVYLGLRNESGDSGLQRLAERDNGPVSTTAADMLAARKKAAQ